MQFSDDMLYEKYIGDFNKGVDTDCVCPICNRETNVYCCDTCCPDCLDGYLDNINDLLSFIPMGVRIELVAYFLQDNGKYLKDWAVNGGESSVLYMIKTAYTLLTDGQRKMFNSYVLDKFIIKCNKYQDKQTLNKVINKLLADAKFETDMEGIYNG